MVAFNFKAKFADDVEAGRKRQTIRLKKRAVPGDALQLYTGMRTKKCRKLRDEICASVRRITIRVPVTPEESEVDKTVIWAVIRVDAELLTFEESTELAWDDGFDSVDSFIEFFRDQYGLPFHGFLITW